MGAAIDQVGRFFRAGVHRHLVAGGDQMAAHRAAHDARADPADAGFFWGDLGEPWYHSGSRVSRARERPFGLAGQSGLTEASYKMRSTPGSFSGAAARDLQHLLNERCDLGFLRRTRACHVKIAIGTSRETCCAAATAVSGVRSSRLRCSTGLPSRSASTSVNRVPPCGSAAMLNTTVASLSRMFQRRALGVLRDGVSQVIAAG